MIKKLSIIIVAVFIALSCPISAIAQLIFLEFTVNKDSKTGQLVQSWVFKRDDEIIAKRIFSIGKTILSEGKIPDGMVVENYSSGKAKNIMFYMKGKRNGHAISLYENGRIKTQGYYKDDNPTGKGFYYFESGAIKAEFEIKNGKELYHYEYTESGKKGRYRTADGNDVVD